MSEASSFFAIFTGYFMKEVKTMKFKKKKKFKKMKKFFKKLFKK